MSNARTNHVNAEIRRRGVPENCETAGDGVLEGRGDVLRWHRSTYSGGANNCVEAARPTRSVLVRDSKVDAGPILELRPAAWSVFLGSLA